MNNGSPSPTIDPAFLKALASKPGKFSVAVAPVGSEMISNLLAQDYEPMWVFLGPVFTADGQQKMDYVCWLKKTNSPIESAQGMSIPKNLGGP